MDESKDSFTTKEYWEIFYSHCEGDNNYRGKGFWLTSYEIINAKSEDFMRLCSELHYEARKTCDARMKFLRNTMYRISCFSSFNYEEELMENTTMWSHYADNHRGFCVKYSLDFEEYKYKDILLCGLFPVKYTSRTETITANQLLNLKEKNNELRVDNTIKKKIIKSLLSKSRFWSYEKEWRLVLSEKECCLLYENNIPFPRIEAIYLGCRMDKSVEQVLLKTGEELNFDIYETRQSDNKYILSYYQENRKSLASKEYNHKLNNITSSIKDETEKFTMTGFIHEDLLNKLM